MPTYEYACDACHHQYERFQSIADKPDAKCPVCGKKKVRRLFSAGAGFILKGAGFYNTEYRSGGVNSGAKKDAASSGGSGEGKTEAKPEAKAETKTESKAPAKTEAKPTPKGGGTGKG